MSIYADPMAPGYDPLAGTPLDNSELKPPGTGQPGQGYPDASLMSPAAQQDELTAYLEAADAQSPAPHTGMSDYGEGIADPSQITPEVLIADSYVPLVDLEMTDDVFGDPHERINAPFPIDIPYPAWENDDQYMGLGVPPGVENLDQPIESGHTQITPPDPSAEHGWDAWTGRPSLARVARHENMFTGYSAGVNRRHGLPVEKVEVPYVYLTQQYRDLLLVELKRRGIHNVVVSDVQSVPFTDQVIAVDPSALTPESLIGAEGVLPFDEYFGVGNV